MVGLFSPKEKVKIYRKRFQPGMRVRLERMDDPWAPPPGAIGIIEFVDDIGNIHVRWDNGSSLALVPEEDSFCLLP